MGEGKRVMTSPVRLGNVVLRNSMWLFKSDSDRDPASPSLPMSNPTSLHRNLSLSRSFGSSRTRSNKSPSFSISRVAPNLISLSKVNRPTCGLNG